MAFPMARFACWCLLSPSRLGSFLLAVLGGLLLTACAQGEVDVRLHFAWGGGEARQWRGRVSLAEGRFDRLQLLGVVGADQPGSVQLYGHQLLIRQKSARDYDGFEVTARAAEGEIRIEFLAAGEVKAEVVTVPIRELLENGRTYPLDDRGNRLVVRRVASDAIPVRLQNKSLIFQPGATWTFVFAGRFLGVAPETNLRCRVALRSTVSREVVWEQQYRERADDEGNWPREQSATIELPDREGVYDLVIAMLARRRTPPFQFEAIAKRRVQIVLLDSRTAPQPIASTVDKQAASSRRLVLNIDPGEKNWWQRLTRMPQWTILPGFRADGPLSNVSTKRVEFNGSSWTSLPPGGWQAYPLPLDEIGQPHEIQIDFPADRAQSFSVSIVETNAAGKVIPVGLDSGVDVTVPNSTVPAVRASQRGQHRLTFWPKTKSPLLLMTNLSEDKPALYGRFQVFRKKLLPASATLENKLADNGRLALALFEKPLFPEVFGATESLDPETDRSLEDWQTFYDGATRMIEHVRHVGYGGIAVMVASEGSTLYPSQYWQPTPKHDRGAYFSSGQDPVRKDILEMLFRLCDREGIKLVPTVEFASPLPALERLLWDRTQRAGIQLVDAQGQRVSAATTPRRGRMAYYNPLDPRVQHAMRDVIRELLQRYAHHASFAGVAISLHADGYTQLPDVDWGMDATTWGRFCAARGIATNVNRMSPDIRQQWLDWRCQQLGAFYRSLGQEVAGERSTARLYLSAAQLVNSRPVTRAFRPALPASADIKLAFRELGLDPAYWNAQKNIVTLRPKLFPSNMKTVTTGNSTQEFNRSVYVDDFFRKASSLPGSVFVHEPYLLRLPSFDEVSPYGKKNTFMSLVAQVSSADFANRRRFAHALAQNDSRCIVEGGWVLPMGQEHSIRPFLRIFQQLPDIEFTEPEELGGGTAAERRRAWQPLTIRSATDDGSTYIYIVNDSPWHVDAQVRIDAPASTQFDSLAEPQHHPVTRDGRDLMWTVALQPFDVVAIRAGEPSVSVLDVRAVLPVDVQPALENHILQLTRRAASLVDPLPLPEPANTGFEQWSYRGNSPVNWLVGGVPKGVIREDQDVHEGQHALRVRPAGGVVELLSQPVSAPDSGRLTVSIRAKVPDTEQQPRVRMLLQVDGEDKYPWAPIGGGGSPRQFSPEWREFVFRVSQLPPVQEPLRIGIQVDGAGVVLLDRLQCYDVVVLDDAERKALATMLSMANHLRDHGLVSDCLDILSSYWPQYLSRNVQLSDREVAQQREAEAASERSEQPRQREASAWQRAWQRFRSLRLY